MKNQIRIITPLVTAGIAWYAGYAAKAEGQAQDLIGGLLLAAAFASVVVTLTMLRKIWREVTASPQGESPFKYVVSALITVVLGVVVAGILATKAGERNSSYLGITMIAVVVLVVLANLSSFRRKSKDSSDDEPADHDEASLEAEMLSEV